VGWFWAIYHRRKGKKKNRQRCPIRPTTTITGGIVVLALYHLSSFKIRHTALIDLKWRKQKRSQGKKLQQI